LDVSSLLCDFSGKVYKGVLANGWPVAVKHIVKNEHAETFLREVTSLSHVRHPNLVSLRGYCDGQEECFLVYELCINGNLSEWLFGEYLSWQTRACSTYSYTITRNKLFAYREG
jgi:serine/threonine protein kinase